jgi:alpha-L-fucosidase
MRYEPAPESLARHAVLDWYHDAKFGIFIHWGPYSVPAWAPKTFVEADFENNSYAEWYWNTISIEGSPSRQHHLKTYGEGFPYDNFIPEFREATRAWDPEVWASLFERAGARYVVLTTKHHDGFLLWPSRHPNPFRDGWQSERDLVGELTDAVRAHGMRMGVYYSGGLDWTFQGLGMRDVSDFIEAIPQGEEYARYADAHWRELIDRYQPSILWNDIAYPLRGDRLHIFADYYNRVPEGVINDRFNIPFYEPGKLPFDFVTPEYRVFDGIEQQKWESCRGIGNSFGYNRNETDEDLLSTEDLVHMLVDIVSKNGNLLLNVGPAADGTIPLPQAKRLIGLGRWLRANGDAIYGTRPWRVAASETVDGTRVRFTQKNDAVYAILLGTPKENVVVIRHLALEPGTSAQLLESRAPLPWEARPQGTAIFLREPLAAAPAHSIRFSPTP